MTNDLIAQAEALLGRFAALKEHAKIKHNATILETIKVGDLLLGMVPQLVAEIKRLREYCDESEGSLEYHREVSVTKDAEIESFRAKLEYTNDLKKRYAILIRDHARDKIDLRKELKRMQEQLAKWQQIAIEERALRWAQSPPDKPPWHNGHPNKTFFREKAAEELGLQYTFKTTYEPDGPIEINGERYARESEQKAYIDRLEKAFLAVLSEDETRKDCDCAVCERMRRDAQAALEKIRRG